MLDGPVDQHVAVGVLMLTALLALVAVVRRLAGCTARRRGGAVEDRAWDYCPVCGWPRRSDAGPVAAPAETGGATTHPLEGEQIAVLPSVLLRRGWCREAALDAEGHEVLPSDERSVAWSIWGACDRAFEPHSSPWLAFLKHLKGILSERYGGVSAREWNRHPSRRHEIVVAVAEEIEQRMGFGPPRSG